MVKRDILISFGWFKGQSHEQYKALEAFNPRQRRQNEHTALAFV